MSNEMKVLDFIAQELGSLPPHVIAKFKVKHNGKSKKFDLEIPGKRKGNYKDNLPGKRKGQALSDYAAAQFQLGGVDARTLGLVILALLVVGGIAYTVGKGSKKGKKRK